MSSQKPELSKAQTGPTAVIEQSDSDSLAGLKAGELLLHVFIEETRSLKHPKALDSTVDPIIEIKAFGKSRYSKVIKEVGSGATYWGEHFFFEKKFQTTYELENEKVLISVSDHKLLGFKSVIGTVELNVPTIYYKDKHCIQYQWAALSGLTKNFQDVLGFIKFSVGVFAPGDEQLPLTEERILKSGQQSIPSVLYPPQITTQTYQLSVKVLCAEQLKKMDMIGKCDAYVQVLYGGLEAKTEIKKLTYEPVWNEELRIPVSLPTVNEKVTVRLYDWNSGLQADELMGTITFNIKDIMDKKYKLPFWTNFYGSYDGSKDAFGKIQNEVCELGVEWHGRVMLALSMREEPKANLGTGPIREAVFTKTTKEGFDVKAEVHYAMNLRKDGEDYTVKIRWGTYELTTKKKSSKNRLSEFYESLTLPTLFPFEVTPEEEIPDVFVYLNNGEKDISYIRRPWTYFADLKAKPFTFYFRVNKAKTTTRDDLAGIVKMRLLITKASEKPNFTLYGWDKPIKKKEAKTEYKIHCNIYQAKDLIAGDSSGASDPYLSLYFYGQEAKTSVIPQTLNPVWNEKIEFVTTFDSVEDAPPLVLTLWDQDASSDDFIGTSKIILEKKHLNPETFPKPEWVEVKYGKDTMAVGKILLSICCYSRRELIPRSPYIEPETSRYFVNLKILGLRQLESTGILPVKRAFVRFDVDSLRKRDDKTFLPEKKFVRTEPLNPGANPNILTVINLELNLPRDPAFCPAMTAAVYDYIFKGMVQPLIGTLSIPLGEMITQTSQEMDRRIEKLTKMYYQIQAIEEKKAQLALEKKALVAPVECKIFLENLITDIAFNIEVTEETKLNSSKDHDLESNESKPLLGKFQEGLVDKFIDVKQKKGYLPGENENIQVQLYENRSESIIEEDPDLQVTEEALKSLKYVQIAKYDHHGDEIEQPDTSQFMELGHHTRDGNSKKHYRYCLDHELEKSGMTDESPFLQIPIYRGKRIPEENFLSSILGSKEADYRCVGYLKSMVTVMSEMDKMRFDAKLKHVGKFAKTKGLEFSDDEFLRRRDVVVRLYVIDAEGLPDKDDDSNSDPYLVIKFGKYTQNLRKEYQLDNPNPKFHKCFEFPATLPGASRVTIQLWDWDRLDADDLIGSTDIDIEDRWYSTKWRGLKHIPVETRNLYHPSSRLAQGKVRLWLEILPKDTPSPPIWNITPKPAQEFELRTIVWECKDVPNVDIEDATDLYITGKLDDGQHYRTDTHFRSQNGIGSFNWRMVFPVEIPMKKHRITFGIWDKDLLSANDFIAEATFDFTTAAQRAFIKEETTEIRGGPHGKDLKFWIPCTNSKIVEGRAAQENLGSVLVSMTLVPKAAAELAPVGQGRSDPNQHPYLPPPTGRFELTWSLPKLYNQLIGPIARRKICFVLVGVTLLLIVIMSIPSIIGTEIAKNIL